MAKNAVGLYKASMLTKVTPIVLLFLGMSWYTLKTTLLLKWSHTVNKLITGTVDVIVRPPDVSRKALFYLYCVIFSFLIPNS